MRIGFIGIGNMGSEMARHLLAAGHTLTTYVRGVHSHERASSLGLSLVRTPAEVAAGSEVIFTIVTAGKDVEAVALGPEGIVHDARPGLIRGHEHDLAGRHTTGRRAVARTRHRHA
jgi:2-hydroxy-3-oxopropionate reductase